MFPCYRLVSPSHVKGRAGTRKIWTPYVCRGHRCQPGTPKERWALGHLHVPPFPTLCVSLLKRSPKTPASPCLKSRPVSPTRGHSRAGNKGGRLEHWMRWHDKRGTGTSLKPQPSLEPKWQNQPENQAPAFTQDKEVWFALVTLAEDFYLCIYIVCQPCWFRDEPDHHCWCTQASPAVGSGGETRWYKCSRFWPFLLPPCFCISGERKS